MSDGTKIEWADATWNPITGCSRVSRGCENCYAERLAAGRLQNHPSRKGLTDEHGRWNGEVRFNEDWLDQPFRWRKPRMVFVCAHSDLFHENVPDEWIDRVFAVMALSPRHTFQVLTKRPERMRAYLRDEFRDAMVEGNAQRIHHERTGEDPSLWLAVHLPLPNVWLGVSAEDQATADTRIPLLMKTPAAVRWLSAEPLLGPVQLTKWVFNEPLLDWVVCGGESGPGYRPMAPLWARYTRDECLRAGIPFFMKQMAGKKPIPEDLLIRQYP